MRHNECDSSSRELLSAAQVKGASSPGNPRPCVVCSQTDVSAAVCDIFRQYLPFLSSVAEIKYGILLSPVFFLCPLSVCVCACVCLIASGHVCMVMMLWRLLHGAPW